MIEEFKVGDRVELINLDNSFGGKHSSSKANTVGNIGTVYQEVNKGGYVHVDWDNGSDESYLPKNLRKLDSTVQKGHTIGDLVLQAGTHVLEDERGNSFLLLNEGICAQLNNEGGFIRMLGGEPHTFGTWYNLSNIKEDIVKVYTLSRVNEHDVNLTKGEGLQLVWKKLSEKEQKYIELTERIKQLQEQVDKLEKEITNE